jgi:hypothetical protein
VAYGNTQDKKEYRHDNFIVLCIQLNVDVDWNIVYLR